MAQQNVAFFQKCCLCHDFGSHGATSVIIFRFNSVWSPQIRNIRAASLEFSPRSYFAIIHFNIHVAGLMSV